jgi:hypothetical protein
MNIGCYGLPIHNNAQSLSDLRQSKEEGKEDKQVSD